MLKQRDRQTAQQVGVADLAVSNRWDEVLAAPAVGSSVGVALYDPVARVGGLVHCPLPHSELDPPRARQRPATFVDTGVAELLRAVVALGARPDRLTARITGGAMMLDDNGAFLSGERNIQVATKTLQRNGIRIVGEDTGGNAARAVRLHLDNGRTTVKSRNHQREI
jgi:chemotaxis protein CheD